MKFKKVLIFLSATIFLSASLSGSEKPVATMKSNSQVKYFESPTEAQNISEMFQEGMFYGRIRTNNFYFWWDQEDTVNKDIHFISGLGGSIVYKSASYKGFEFGGALYYSYGIFKDKEDLLTGWKAGKDVFSRFNVVNTGSKNMAVLGQAYLRYKPSKKSEIILGRQLVESFYTKSNDTKMIPNVFDGVVIASKDLESTSVKIAYLAKQKLRDHIESHSVLMVGDCTSYGCSDPTDTKQKIVASWSENDDGAMHKGLTYTNLVANNKSTNAPLIVGDFQNKSISNLTLDTSFYAVPELLSQVMLEANYKIKLGNLSITPGFRYIKQFDNGAGTVGGASLKGTVSLTDAKGYTNPNSLNSQMIAARLVGKFDKYKINLASTYILDEADLVTPWRGFPTAGYTRSMARYNWRANTKSYRLEVVRKTSDIGIYNDIFIQASVMYEDDDAKKYDGINVDSVYYYIGFMQNVDFLDNAQWRYRLGYQDFLGDYASQINNIDTRFELNYFF